MSDSYTRFISTNHDTVSIGQADDQVNGRQDWVSDYLAGDRIPTVRAPQFSGQSELPTVRPEVDGELPGMLKVAGKTAIIRASDNHQTPSERHPADGQLPKLLKDGKLPEVQPIDWGSSEGEVLEITPLNFGSPSLRKLY